LSALEIATKKVHAVHVDDSIPTVYGVMEAENVSFVPVLDDQGKCFGVISADDLLRLHQEKRPELPQYAWELFTHKVIEVHPFDKLERLVELILEHELHHRLIVEKGMVIGVVSSIDIIRALQKTIG